MYRGSYHGNKRANPLVLNLLKIALVYTIYLQNDTKKYKKEGVPTETILQLSDFIVFVMYKPAEKPTEICRFYL